MAFVLYNYGLDWVVNPQDYLTIKAANYKASDEYDNRQTESFIPIAVEKCTSKNFEKLFPDLSNELVTIFLDSSSCLKNLSEIDLYGTFTDLGSSSIRFSVEAKEKLNE